MCAILILQGGKIRENNSLEKIYNPNTQINKQIRFAKFNHHKNGEHWRSAKKSRREIKQIDSIYTYNTLVSIHFTMPELVHFAKIKMIAFFSLTSAPQTWMYAMAGSSLNIMQI